MKLKQIIAIIGLLAAGLLFAYGLSLLAPAKTPVSQAELEGSKRELINKQFELGADSGVLVRATESDYGFYEIYPNVHEGGGFWALVHYTANGVETIDSGNKSEYEVSCEVLDKYQVPVSMVLNCTSEAGVIDRATKAVVKDPLQLSEQHPIPVR